MGLGSLLRQQSAPSRGCQGALVQLLLFKVTAELEREGWELSKSKCHEACCSETPSSFWSRCSPDRSRTFISRVLRKFTLAVFASFLIMFLDESIFRCPHSAMITGIPCLWEITSCPACWAEVYQFFQVDGNRSRRSWDSYVPGDLRQVPWDRKIRENSLRSQRENRKWDIWGRWLGTATQPLARWD